MKTLEDMAREAGYDVDAEGVTMPHYHPGGPADERAHLERFAAIVEQRVRDEYAVYMWIMDGDLHGHAPRSYGYTLRASDGYTQEEVDKRLHEDPTLKATALYALKARP